MSLVFRYLSLPCCRCDSRHCQCDTSPPPGAALVGSLGRVVEREPTPDAANGPFRPHFVRPTEDRHLPGTPIRYQRGEHTVVGVLLTQDSESVTILELGRSVPEVLHLHGATLEVAP